MGGLRLGRMVAAGAERARLCGPDGAAWRAGVRGGAGIVGWT